MKQTLPSLRKEIDKIDGNILDLIADRIGIVHKVAEYKKNKGLDVYNEERENAVLDRLKEQAQSRGIDKKLIEDIFKSIMKDSKKIQKRDMK